MLNEAILSNLRQTYTNWEHCIVDDNSNPPLVSPVSDPRVRIARSRGVGQFAAVNQAHAMSRGQYITKMDSDDWNMPERIDKELGALLEVDAHVVTCGAIYADEQGREIKPFANEPMRPLDYVCGKQLGHPNNATVMASMAVWSVAMPLDESLLYVGDAEWNIKVIKAGYTKWVHVPDYLYKYRVHGDSLCVKRRGEPTQEFAALIERYK